MTRSMVYLVAGNMESNEDQARKSEANGNKAPDLLGKLTSEEST